MSRQNVTQYFLGLIQDKFIDEQGKQLDMNKISFDFIVRIFASDQAGNSGLDKINSRLAEINPELNAAIGELLSTKDFWQMFRKELHNGLLIKINHEINEVKAQIEHEKLQRAETMARKRSVYSSVKSKSTAMITQKMKNSKIPSDVSASASPDTPEVTISSTTALTAASPATPQVTISLTTAQSSVLDTASQTTTSTTSPPPGLKGMNEGPLSNKAKTNGVSVKSGLGLFDKKEKKEENKEEKKEKEEKKKSFNPLRGYPT